MFVENRLTGGDFVSPAPLGLMLTLQYNDMGVLHKVYEGVERSTDLTNRLLRVFVEHETVPNRISIKNGTTWISGVLFSSDIIPKLHSAGKLPGAITEECISVYTRDPSQFRFYAGQVSSLAAKFRGNLIVRNWLKMAGFGVLPGYIIPGNITGSKFKEIVNKESSCPVKYPLIPELFVHRAGQDLHFSCELQQACVRKVETYVSDQGDIRAKVHLKNSEKVLDYDYYVVAANNISSQDWIIYDGEDNRFIYNYRLGEATVNLTTTKLACPICGKILSFNRSEPTQCSDPHCNSRLYSRMVHMLESLSLPCISRSQYDKYAKKIGDRFSLFDVFDLPEYKDVELDVTPAVALRSIIPIHVLPKFSSIDIFVLKCSKSIDTIEYYLSHPDKMWEDLGLDKHIYRKFFDWLQIPENRDDAIRVLHDSHIHITTTAKDPEAPGMILDNTLVMITGEFRRGNTEYIKSVLENYGATVTQSYSSDVNCVVVGDLMVGIAGQALRSAKADHIPVYSEEDFIRRYQLKLDEKVKP